MALNLGLLSNNNFVETPFIKVVIGDYTFGVYDVTSNVGYDINGTYKLNKIKYPNYIQSLKITKINGQVNRYMLNIVYTITDKDDPNFFEKVFSSVSKTRKIVFSYGDLSTPSYTYKDEEAIILNVQSRFDISSSKITYVVSAISSGGLLNVGSYTFQGTYDQPSNIIRELLYDVNCVDYGLLDVFPGMRDRDMVEQLGLLPNNDQSVHIETKTNISLLSYLNYLIDLMKSQDSGLLKPNLYSLIISDDTSGILGGTYFKIVQCDTRVEHSDAYELDIGFPSKNAVIGFDVDNDESYSIFYDYQSQLNDADYVMRLDNKGDYVDEYAPVISSGTEEFVTEENQKSWWSKVTEFPIKCAITIRGLLRPAILMSYVRLNVFFFGKKHISSGLYIVTKQQDEVSTSGFRTTLNLMRIAQDDEFSPTTYVNEGSNASKFSLM